MLRSKKSIFCETFNWAVSQERDDRVHENGSSGRKYDVIFASDCLYDTTYYDDLINIFTDFVHENGMIIIVYKLRHPDREYEFFKALQRGEFCLSVLTEECIDTSLEHLRKTGLYVVIATRKKSVAD